ncbi:type III secretion system inner membrane ring subunit SctD [Neochlamydia sp. S13]|uniref:type III secretion system inner membrane ring subunit SctD n=1 Tax=Neochlamydia sp. S13 TaxID=1353976 RepID=UPI0005A80988|nr:type III secretion system inner membrane ring subunit SctD [Neochlamydia sp. S13]BBI17851.1 Putative type III secretion system protein SctD [Neochlamydia sp. S13]
MVAKLVAEEGVQKGLVLSLDEGNEWVIGRDPDACQLLIEDPSASRKHLLCRQTPEGIVIQALSLTHPVYVNEQPIQESWLLHHGDRVQIGEGLYRFYAEGDTQWIDEEKKTLLNGHEEINDSALENLSENAESEKALPTLEDEHSSQLFASQSPLSEAKEAEAEENLPSSAREHEQPLGKEDEQSAKDPAAFASTPFNEEEDFFAPLEENKEKASEQEKKFSEEEEPSKDQSAEDKDKTALPLADDKDASPQELESDDEFLGVPPEQEGEQEGMSDSLAERQGALDTPNTSKEDEKQIMNDSPASQLFQEASHSEDQQNEEDISIFEEPLETANYPEIHFDLAETGRWLIKVVGGPNHGAEFTLQPSCTYIIGTDPNSCDIVFHDTSVSRQHAKITVTEEDTISLEDLGSRNGTFVDGKPLTGRESVPTNTLILMGTSSFVVYDREGEMQTIIAPLLPSIVKTLKEDPQELPPPPASETEAAVEEVPAAAPPVIAPPPNKVYPHEALGAFILIAIITGLFVVIGIGTATLFKSKPVVSQQVINPERDLTEALSAFPHVKYSFNRNTGRLLLVGHVLSGSDKTQLLYNLQGLPYLRSIDDSGVIIDEGVWREINQILSQNSNWKGISIHSPTPGHFVISGYLKSRKQAEQLWDYIASNFPYLDLLEKRVIVEEDAVSAISALLQNQGFKDVSSQMNEGEVILSGHIPAGKMNDYSQTLINIKEIPGVRTIKNFVAELAPEQSMINITDRYEITGVSHQGDVNTNVVINGRILTRGDVLDGMTIISIKPTAVFLEKEGVKYRIEYNR